MKDYIDQAHQVIFDYRLAMGKSPREIVLNINKLIEALRARGFTHEINRTQPRSILGVKIHFVQ